MFRTRAPPKRSPASSPVRCTSCSERWRACCRSCARGKSARSDLPTMIEGGIPDFVALTFTGVVAPTGTPATIVAKLNAAINESLNSAEIVAALGKLGAEVRTGSAQEFAAFIAKERAMWTDVVTRADIKAQ